MKGWCFIIMEGWKLRLIAEYKQLKVRYEKLKLYNDRTGADIYLISESRKNPMYYNHSYLLRKQQEIMREYLDILRIRAKLANIDLTLDSSDSPDFNSAYPKDLVSGDITTDE